MNGPQTLSRPLAARVASLPAAEEPIDAPPVSAGVIAAAEAALEAGKTHYTDRPGILPLRERISEWFGYLDIPPDQITITIGVTEARFVTFKQLVPEGSRIIVLGDPKPVEPLARLLSLDLRVFPATAHDDDSRDEVLREAAAEFSGANLVYGSSLYVMMRLLYLNLEQDKEMWGEENLAGPVRPLPPYLVCELFDPSGQLEVGDWERRQVQRMAQYGHKLSGGQDKIVYIGEFDDLPGWRVGFMAGSKAANKLRAYKQSMTICSPSISQWAALGLEGSA